jgi:diacylglycerol kinase (ATP)
VELLSGSVLLIVNPAARRARRAREVAIAAFRELGIACDAVCTDAPGDAARLAGARLSHHRAIFVLGGDGTVMEVVGALAYTGVPMGILPAGTGNLVARSLGIPLAVGRAVRALVPGRPVAVDLGALDSGRRFAFSTGVGVDARMIAETGAATKRRLGIVGYALTAIRATLVPRSFQVTVTVDDVVIERRAAAAMIANFGSVLNDLVVLGPSIRGDDGRLDLCVFAPADAREAIGLAWRLVRKRFGAHPAVTYRSGRTFRVVCDPPQLYQADGEVLGTTPFEVRVEPGAAMFLVPCPRD